MEGRRPLVGFRAAQLFLFDLPLIALLVVTGVRLFYDASYRHRVNETLDHLTSLAYGGLWWFLLVIWIGISALWAVEPALARYATLHTAMLLAAAIITAQIVRDGDAVPLLWALTLGAVIQSLLAVAQVVHGSPLGLGWLGELQQAPETASESLGTIFRGYGLAAHPNMLAGYLLVSLVAVTALLRHYGFYSARGGLAAGAFAVITAGLLVTYSRTGLIAGVGLLAIVFVLKMKQIRHISTRKGLAALALIALGAALVVILLGDTLIERNWGLQDTKGIKNRLTLGYSDTFEVIKDHPILGVGQDNLMTAVGRDKTSPEESVLLPAHNVFLVILSELGIAGLILFVLVCGTLLVSLFRQPTGELFIWTLAFLALFLTMPFDYYAWMDYRARLLLLWLVGMWWGYKLPAQSE